MTSMPASRSARATTLTPRSCPSRPTLASSTRIGALMLSSLGLCTEFRLDLLLHTVYRILESDATLPASHIEPPMESLANPKTLVEQAYDVILDAICAGTLKPGERLTQDSVAKRLNVSRQPVNNALLVLKTQGFVRDAGRRGLAVAPLDPKLFEAIYQFRSAIEPLAVKLATPRLNAEATRRARALLARGRA